MANLETYYLARREESGEALRAYLRARWRHVEIDSIPLEAREMHFIKCNKARTARTQLAENSNAQQTRLLKIRNYIDFLQRLSSE